ncbi:hypothetical protein NKL07_22005 [Mesorhizobium sp. C280B]|uniref:hypothetical protein n=1 Tax=unclassified Mesorhizobium TaxID=325217 RepID=UPI0003CF2B32|nr:hypothetical protein [Mesorhizobium sp. LSJC280B00]ESW92951.1 hypothetical protein X772_03105 [Mesorhizobium sp. LSJC280B00]
MARILEQGRNRASAEEAGSFVDKYEEHEERFQTLRSKFMSDAKKIRDEQKEVLDDAKSQGIPKKVVKTIVDARALEGKAKAKLLELEDDDRKLAIDIRTALGDYADLPLGAAAVAADGQDGTTAAIVDAATKAWDNADPKSKGKGKAAPAAH